MLACQYRSSQSNAQSIRLPLDDFFSILNFEPCFFKVYATLSPHHHLIHKYFHKLFHDRYPKVMMLLNFIYHLQNSMQPQGHNSMESPANLIQQQHNYDVQVCTCLIFGKKKYSQISASFRTNFPTSIDFYEMSDGDCCFI